MTDTLRWGIAATGGIAAKMAAALQTLPNAEIVAVGSRSLDSADEFAARFDIPRAHGTYEALYADPDVDIVYVASPHSHHRDMTIAALDAGKHVLCEKAFAINAAQASDMIDAARRNKRFLMEAMWTWFIPAVAEVKRRVAAGDIGTVTMVDADFGVIARDEQGRHRRADLAGGALLDLGIYPLTFACYVLGEHPDRIRSIARITDGGVDSTLGGVASYPGGALSMFHTSLDGYSGQGARIFGDEGQIIVHRPFWYTEGFTVIPRVGEPERVEMPHQGLAHEAAHAMERIRGGHLESDVIDLATSLKSMEMLDSIRADVGIVYPDD